MSMIAWVRKSVYGVALITAVKCVCMCVCVCKCLSLNVWGMWRCGYYCVYGRGWEYM